VLHFRPLHFMLAVLASLATANAACSQEIRWRTDYNLAWKEARDCGRPLFVDIGTATCTWCRRFDDSTLRDPAVIRVLNDQFIPVKLDGDRNPNFVHALNIRAYPSLVFGTADGKVLGCYEGFVDSDEFRRRCAAALALCDPPPAKVVETTKRGSDWEYDFATIVRICASLHERIAADYLRDAETALKANDIAKARHSLAKVFTLGADTKAAAVARRHVERLDGPAAISTTAIAARD
jgi:thioredoxin-related protein